MLRFFKRNVTKDTKRALVDYTIVAANSSMLLRERVREHVNRGWEPNGGPVYNFDEHTMMQGMVKYKS